MDRQTIGGMLPSTSGGISHFFKFVLKFILHSNWLHRLNRGLSKLPVEIICDVDAQFYSV